ncbi:E3 ubiquitin-protein ligase HECW2 [Anopheles arabiensis]|uniref:HECT-type E3 ubiquitin transferase n=1 Tax=Anopheles arabiensis TaxID=7173 RepID=A0A1I8JT79_ANOAR|nr:E3 ubiquitin-protein ligase HECW2 [Anopheles arabiensis]
MSCEREGAGDEPEAACPRPTAHPPGKEPEPEADPESEQDGLAIGGQSHQSDGEDEDDDDEEDDEEDDDEEEEEEPPELRVAVQQDFPPTPYEECLDLKMFELRTEPASDALAAQEPERSEEDEEGEEEGSGEVEADSVDNSAEDNLQPETDPAIVPSPSATSLSAATSGVRRKSEPPANGAPEPRSPDAAPDEEPTPNGTKKKVRPNRLSPERAGCSRKKQFWIEGTAGTGGHRPLERSWPPKAHRPSPGRPFPGATTPGDGFSFDIIDMDEQQQQHHHEEVEGAVGGQEMPDAEGNPVGGQSTPRRRNRHPDRNGNDEPDTGESARATGAGKQPLRKMVGRSGAEEHEVAGAVRPHRPLARTPSNGREPRCREYGPIRPLPVDYTADASVHTARSPASEPGTPGDRSPDQPQGRSAPQPRQLTRVGGGRAGSELVCPPTPTHHARRNRAGPAPSAAPPEHGFGPPELRLHRQQTAPDQPPEGGFGEQEPPPGEPGEGATVRHVPSMRLPSIPERTRAILAEPDEPLPPAWEARMDSHGRIFYIDHATRTTSWQRPGPLGTSAVLLPDPHRQQLDRRYASIRRTIYEHMRPENGAAPSTSSTGPVATRSRSSSTGRSAVALPSTAGSFHPALLMLCRSDFYSMLHTNGDAIQLYNRNAALKHMVSRVRRDPGCFGRYQHNRDLVALVNCFAQPAQELPSGWETKLDQSGKQFFIDHVNRRTSFIDPRLPTEGPRARHHRPPVGPAALLLPPAGGPFPDERPIPPPRPPGTLSRLAHVSSPEIPVAYNDKVVAFLRQPNILEILRERHGAAACSRQLREKINAIRVEGTTALDRYSHDLELTILLSLFEDEVMTYVPPRARSPPEPGTSAGYGPCGGLVPGGALKPGGRHVQRAPMRRDFEAKLRTFYRKLESKGYGQGPHKLRLEVRRAHLVEDAFERIMAASRRDLQRCRLNIVWDTEDGLDYGGPSREFFYLLSRQLFSPYRNMFEYSANDIYTVQIAPERPTDRDDILEWYRFAGRVLGLALVHQYLLDAFFTRPFYKALLRLPVSLSDLESLDSSFHQSLLWIRDNNMDNCGELGLNFTVTEERSDGTSIDIELKPNGRNITVSERNKRDYLDRIIKWRLERGVLEQTEWLVRGFNEVVDHRLVAVFDASELELVISGTVEIDVHDWRANTEYRGGYHDTHHVIMWFWAVIERMSNEQRLRLLQFVTGTSSIPHDGFAGLRGSNGLRRFCIEKWGKANALPRSHTCFNRLDLPPYPTPDVLYEKLVLAVEETNTFGIE